MNTGRYKRMWAVARNGSTDETRRDQRIHNQETPKLKPMLIKNYGIPRKRKSVSFDDTANSSNARNVVTSKIMATQETQTVKCNSKGGLMTGRPKQTFEASSSPSNKPCNLDLQDQEDTINKVLLELEQCIPKMNNQYRIMNERYQDCCISLEEIFKTMEEYREAVVEEIGTTNRENSSPFLENSGQNKNRNNIDHYADNKTSSGSCSTEALKKICKERSKLTLKHPEKGRGLEEIVEGTGVYVNISKLKKCRSSSKNGRELAIGLMRLVFSDTALRECSLFEDQSRRSGRVALDKTAIDAIMDYIKQRGRDMQWEIDDSSIEKSMRTRLQNMRYRSKDWTENKDKGQRLLAQLRHETT